MELQLIISGDHGEILEVLKRLDSIKGTTILPTIEDVPFIGPSVQLTPLGHQEPVTTLETFPPVKEKPKGYHKRNPDRKCLTCGNPTHGKHGWNVNYCTRKCFDASMGTELLSTRQRLSLLPREFSIPEGQDLGPVSNREANFRKKLDKIKHTCPPPRERPDIQRNLID